MGPWMLCQEVGVKKAHVLARGLMVPLSPVSSFISPAIDICHKS